MNNNPFFCPFKLKKILVELALERPELVQEWIGANIKRIASEIYRDCLFGGKDGGKCHFYKPNLVSDPLNC